MLLSTGDTIGDRISLSYIISNISFDFNSAAELTEHVFLGNNWMGSRKMMLFSYYIYTGPNLDCYFEKNYRSKYLFSIKNFIY